MAQAQLRSIKEHRFIAAYKCRANVFGDVNIGLGCLVILGVPLIKSFWNAVKVRYWEYFMSHRDKWN